MSGSRATPRAALGKSRNRSRQRCAEPGCSKRAVVYNRCRPHGLAWHRQLDTRTCTIDGCDNKLYAAGYCGKHYRRWKANGDPLVQLEGRRTRLRAECCVLGCHDTATCYDDEVPYCGDHRRRLREYGDPLYRPPQGRRPTITEIPVGVRFLMACYVRKTRAGEDVSPAEMWGMRKYSRIHNGLRRAAALTNAGGTLTS